MALKAGFRYINTAQMYENEAEVGQDIINSGMIRKEIFLTHEMIPFQSYFYPLIAFITMILKSYSGT